MTTLDHQPGTATSDDAPRRTLVQQLASAYAERLSCLRCDASPLELAENAELIADLERRYRAQRRAEAAEGAAPVVDVRHDPDALRTTMRLDPASFLG